MAEPVPPPDRAALRALLDIHPGPHWETALMRAAWPDAAPLDWTPLELYRRHFTLFAALYGLADDYAVEGRRLDIDCMRTTLQPAGSARGRTAGDDAIEEWSLRGFYADPGNLDWMDAEAAARAVAWGHGLFDEAPRRTAALAALGLEAGADRTAVQSRFRELARRSHPDSPDCEPGLDFVALNRAYRYLMDRADYPREKSEESWC